MEGNKMNRSLNPKHISMITMGGAVGTGLFVATNNIISQAGPGSATLAYLVTGAMLYFLMSSTGELVIFYPVSGSFSPYSTRFIDSSLGFTMGWLYWALWSLVTSVDVIVASDVFYFWGIFRFLHPTTWSLIFTTTLPLLNIFFVKSFGETESWLSLIKVLAIIVLIIFGFLMIFGILGGHTYGFESYTKGQAPFVNDISGSLGVLLVAGFSVGSTEVVTVTADESDDPKKSMPKAIKQVSWRILSFYVLSIAVIGAIIPYTDPSLLRASSLISQNPSTTVFGRIGIAFAASAISAVILTSLLPAVNPGVHTTGRMLHSLSSGKKAPQFLSKLNKTTRLLLRALLTTYAAVVVAITYASFNSGVVFNLLEIIGSMIMVVWGSNIWSQIRLRQAIKKQGQDLNKVLPHKAPFYPLGPIIVITILSPLLFGGSVEYILKDQWLNALKNFSPLIILASIYFIHKIIHKTEPVKLETIDLKPHDYDN